MEKIKGVADLFAPIEEKGCAKIVKYEFKNSENPLFNLRAIRDGGLMFYIKDGTYCKLHVNKQLMMSDTPMERRSNCEFIRKANGKVLIAGLGLSLIIHNIINKPEVEKIVVIEKYQDVIDLVAPKFFQYRHKIEIVCADIFDWNTHEKFDTIYFDIWPDITTDNLDEIKRLHNKFKFKLNRENPNCWMNSWMKEFLQRQKREERSNSWY